MSQLLEPMTQRPDSRPTPRRRGDERSGRWAVVGVMIVALALSGFAESWATDWKRANGGSQAEAATRGALGGMSTYALALMLGGLRGPLVMILWSKVENQKIDKDLEDVDTMIEWIRLLQPEFDTVHIFQMWNKAYNISAMMASTASKYTTILDAIDYGRRVIAGRANDLNIVDQLGRIFGEKLGGPNVSERKFYRRQFREDTMTDANRQKAYPEDNASYRRMGLKYFDNKNGPILDANNNIDSRLLVVTAPRPANLPATAEWNDGSDLQYLRQFQPFPYGLDALAMGYNYAKRAEVTMNTTGQKPLQLSEMVLDAYPGLLLKQWAEREQERADEAEVKAFGSKASPDDRVALVITTPPNAPIVSSEALAATVYGYELSNRLATEAIKEYERHIALPRFFNPYMSYTSHLVDLRALQALTAADLAYTRSFLPGSDLVKLSTEAGEGYRKALSVYERISLTYNVESGLIPHVFNDATVKISQLSDQQLDELYQRLLAAVKAFPDKATEYADQRAEYGSAIARCQIRLQQLGYGQKSILQTH